MSRRKRYEQMFSVPPQRGGRSESWAALPGDQLRRRAIPSSA
jgi:hypothetical protein